MSGTVTYYEKNLRTKKILRLEQTQSKIHVEIFRLFYQQPKIKIPKIQILFRHLHNFLPIHQCFTISHMNFPHTPRNRWLEEYFCEKQVECKIKMKIFAVRFFKNLWFMIMLFSFFYLWVQFLAFCISWCKERHEGVENCFE